MNHLLILLQALSSYLTIVCCFALTAVVIAIIVAIPNELVDRLLLYLKLRVKDVFIKYIITTIKKWKTILTPPKPPKIVKMDFWDGDSIWARRCVTNYKNNCMLKFIQSYSQNNKKSYVVRIYKNKVLNMRWINVHKIEIYEYNNKKIYNDVTISIYMCSEMKKWKCKVINKNVGGISFLLPNGCIKNMETATKIVINNVPFITVNFNKVIKWLRV